MATTLPARTLRLRTRHGDKPDQPVGGTAGAGRRSRQPIVSSHSASRLLSQSEYRPSSLTSGTCTIVWSKKACVLTHTGEPIASPETLCRQHGWERLASIKLGADLERAFIRFRSRGRMGLKGER